MTRTWAEIYLARLEHNVSLLSHLAGNRPLIAVVKANAYGHGARRISLSLSELGVRTFGVADLGEARELRSWKPECEIIVFGGCQPGEAEEFRRLNLIAALFSDLAIPTGVPCEVKVETGMGRLGVAPEVLPALLAKLGTRLTGVYSTLSCADVDPQFTQDQIRRFGEVTSRLSVRRHLANSAGLRFPEARFDAVRPGLALYGIANTDALKGLQPLLEWKARVLAVNTYPADTPVGYGAAFRTARPSRLAVLGVGYADGYSRRWSNVGRVGFEKGLAPVVGRVSMDLTTVDVTDLGDVKTGDEAILLDSDPESPLSASAQATALNTIPYEVLTGIGSRVARVYRKD